LSETQKSLVAKAHQARQVKLESNVVGDNDRWSPVGSYDRNETPESGLEADDERRIILDRLGLLEERERTVLALRYGLDGEVPLTLKEIGRRLGVTREWARKIELKAVRKLDADSTSEPAGGPRRWNGTRVTYRSAEAASMPKKAAEPSSKAPSDTRRRPARKPRLRPRALPAAKPAAHAL
jgi:RNA polymerase primary sigma factor